jgi:predicted transcriptional regulator
MKKPRHPDFVETRLLAMLDISGLEPLPFRVLVSLCVCYKAKEDDLKGLGEIMGLALGDVQKCLKILAAKGFVTAETKKGRPCIYTVKALDDWPMDDVPKLFIKLWTSGKYDDPDETVSGAE